MSKTKILMITAVFSLLVSGYVFASIDVYPFKNQQLEQRFNHLTEVLRCPKCQNNNLADSNAELAQALKDIIFEKIQAGESDAQIIAYLKQRYGDFISYQPPFNYKTLVIWVGPFLLLILGAMGIFKYASNRQTVNAKSYVETETDTEQREKLAQWAQDFEQDSNSSEDKS